MARSPRAVACAHVYRHFPLLRGSQPRMAGAGTGHVFTFAASVPVGPNGPTLRQVVRVTVNERGQIVKVVASR